MPTNLRNATLCVLISTALVAHAQTEHELPERVRNVPPQLREQIWRGLPPEEKMEIWRRLSPAERQALRERLTPEQREAMRQGWLQERGRRIEGGEAVRRLTPEERHHLREQVREAHREWRYERRRAADAEAR
ncbi:MAG: hypothetical protein RMK97_02395 [Sutterellaceae bacterium]|nr:hypothetical protein [Burkholderiaceae bacterium]MDW8429345.1 hypothetical protein [Sutterellaceae bacterium]